jgi:hypothetical protein
LKKTFFILKLPNRNGQFAEGLVKNTKKGRKIVASVEEANGF